MCLAGWDHMVENWAAGRFQNTNTFKVSSQTETDSSSAGTCRRPVRTCRSNRVCRQIQQICLEGWRLYNHRNHCSLHGPILSGESSRVQHPWHRDKGLTAAQIDVKNATQGLWEDDLHSFYLPRKDDWASRNLPILIIRPGQRRRLW